MSKLYDQQGNSERGTLRVYNGPQIIPYFRRDYSDLLATVSISTRHYLSKELNLIYVLGIINNFNKKHLEILSEFST